MIMRIILDMETDSLLDTVTKIHCICYYDIDSKQSGELTDYTSMKQLFISNKDLTIIAHNIIKFDIPVLKKILGIDFTNIKKVDTLALSWYLYPNRVIHGLEQYGIELGVEKPKIEDWSSDNIEAILIRCQEDVKINTLLFYQEIKLLLEIYGDRGKANRLINYLTFKLECAAEQEEEKWKLDVEKCKVNLDFLLKERELKAQILSSVMPPKITYKVVKKPDELLKKDGKVSVRGQKWLDLLKSMDLPSYYNSALKIVDKTEPGNPGSHQQLKDWLFSLGWQPETFKYVRENPKDYTSPQRAIPQISLVDGSDICPSVKVLYEKEPNLNHIESFFVIRHRIGILEGFLETKDINNFLQAEISGFTNTLRFKHSHPLVNLPTIMKPYGQQVRECLIASDDDHILCGSDLSGAEESTKHHYMYFYDPKYVLEMRTPTFDPHLNIAVQAKLVTLDTANWYKWLKAPDEKKELYLPYVKEEHIFFGDTKEGKELKAQVAIVRDKSKKSNFAAVYGAGVPKIALTAGITEKLAKILHTAYWKVNWSVKQIALDATHKTVNGQMWLYNPVSKLWYSLRLIKDKFSTLNQGTAVYCFDIYVNKVRSKGWKLCGQFHDEFIANILKTQEEQLRLDCLKSIEEANEQLKLNIKLGISIDFGHSYSDIH